MVRVTATFADGLCSLSAFLEYSERESVNTKCPMDWQVQFTITDSTAKRKVSNK